ncbi:hypothetical protein HUJ04_008613 [Dendroctonus ponderosae]|nr:hypothetical protein HUJ04_008613 [Dendroctonus ponderosae]
MDLNLKVVNQQASETGTSFKRKSSFRRVGELCDRVVQFYFSEETTQNDAAAVNTSSPVNKRRGFSG